MLKKTGNNEFISQQSNDGSSIILNLFFEFSACGWEPVIFTIAPSCLIAHFLTEIENVSKATADRRTN